MSNVGLFRAHSSHEVFYGMTLLPQPQHLPAGATGSSVVPVSSNPHRQANCKSSRHATFSRWLGLQLLKLRHLARRQQEVTDAEVR
jgi:hypothetical protein